MAEAARRADKSGPTSRSGAEPVLNRLQMENLTPAQIVAELDRYVIGQNDGQRLESVKDEAGKVAAQRLADLLVEQLLEKKPTRNGRRSAVQKPSDEDSSALERQESAVRRRLQRERNRLLRLLNEHALDEET